MVQHSFPHHSHSWTEQNTKWQYGKFEYGSKYVLYSKITSTTYSLSVCRSLCPPWSLLSDRSASALPLSLTGISPNQLWTTNIIISSTQRISGGERQPSSMEPIWKKIITNRNKRAYPNQGHSNLHLHPRGFPPHILPEHNLHAQQ